MPSKTNAHSPVNYNAQGRHDRLLLGIFLMVSGEALFVLMGAMIKTVTVFLPVAQVLFFRNAFSLLLMLLVIQRVGFERIQSARLSLHLLRAIFGLSAMFLIFYAYSSIKLSEASLLKTTSPVFVSLMAWLVLKERLSALSWLAIMLAFSGAVFILYPQDVGFELRLGVLAGLASALLAALAKIVVRRIGSSEPSEVIVFYFSLIASAACLPFAFAVWQPVQPSHWLYLVLMGLFGTVGQLLMTKAYTVAKAGLVGLFSYLSIPSAAIMGWFFWQESINLSLILGSVVIVFAGLLSFFANRRA